MSKKKNIILLTLGRGINGLITLLLVPYMARSLDYSDYATYGQVLLVTELLMVMINVAANQYLYVLFANNEYNKRDILWNALLINLGLSIIGILIMFFASSLIGVQFDNPKIEQHLRLYVLATPFLLFQSTFNFVLYYFNRFKHSILVEFILNALRILSIIVAVQVFSSITYIFLFLLIVNIIIIPFYLYKFPFSFIKGKFNIVLIKQFFKYGYALGLTTILGILLKRTDGIMVSTMLTPKDYAVYRMGAIEIPFLMTIFSSVMTVTLPNVTKLYHEGKIDELIQLKRKAITASAVVMYPILIFILVFSQPLLTFYLSDKYIDSIPIFVVYNLVLFLRINDYRDILVAANKTRLILFIDIIVFTLNICLNYVFIRLFGSIGAAWATIIVIFTLALLLLNFTNKVVLKKWGAFFHLKNILIIISISIILAALFYLLYNIYPSFNTLCLIFLLYSIITYSILYKTSDFPYRFKKMA